MTIDVHTMPAELTFTLSAVDAGGVRASPRVTITGVDAVTCVAHELELAIAEVKEPEDEEDEDGKSEGE